MTPKDFDTRLDEIMDRLDRWYAGLDGDDDDFLDSDEAKQALRDLFLEVVGDDEAKPKDLEEAVYIVPARNQLRQQLRDTITLTIGGK